MNPANTKLISGRAFVRSLNILLKFAHLYGFEHTRTTQQFETAWSELREAISTANGSGLLLGASGSQLLLDGIPIEAAPAERSFAQLLSSAGLAGIQFTSLVAKDDLFRLLRAFPAENPKPAALAGQLKAALASSSSIRIHEVRPVPVNVLKSDVRGIGPLSTPAPGSGRDSTAHGFVDPKNLFPSLSLGGTRGTSQVAPNRTDAVASRVRGNGGSPLPRSKSRDEDIVGILKVLTQLGRTVASEGGTKLPGAVQEELMKLPSQSRERLRQALAAVATQPLPTNSKNPKLLRLAEHLAMRFALESYERGDVKANAVHQLIGRMSVEIENLRRILGTLDPKPGGAGGNGQSTADLLDLQFWTVVPETSRRSVLASPDAWCIPARYVRQYAGQLFQRGDEKTAFAVLQSYASCIQSREMEARRQTAIGLSDLADVYASSEGRSLVPAIQAAGAQISLEGDDHLQALISGTFVRLAQEASSRRNFPAVIQALDSLDRVERHRPALAQNLRPRIGLDKSVPEFLDDALREHDFPTGLEAFLNRVPRIAAGQLVSRFNRASNYSEMQRLVEMTASVGNETVGSLQETLRSGAANDAAEATGLLSRVDAASLERWLPERLPDWPRQTQDRVVRLLAMGSAPQRGQLLAKLLRLLDPVLVPLAIDEIGLSQDAGCVPALLGLAGAKAENSPGSLVRLKAVEALGRLRARESVDLLREIAGGRYMFHWTHPLELRLAAVQSLTKIHSNSSRELVIRSGFSAHELSMAPLDPLPNAKYSRLRRYPRVRMAQNVQAVATAGQDTCLLEIRALSLSGGIAAGERHLPTGTLASMKIGSSLRPIRAQVLMRDARSQGFGFEFADMDLEERARLRKLLLENGPTTSLQEDEVLAQTSA
jgi:hypothetical protein